MNSAPYKATGIPAGIDHRAGVSVSPSFDLRDGFGNFTAVSLHMLPAEAVRLMAALPLAVLEAEPTDGMRALIRATLASALEAMGGVGHA